MQASTLLSAFTTQIKVFYLGLDTTIINKNWFAAALDREELTNYSVDFSDGSVAESATL